MAGRGYNRRPAGLVSRQPHPGHLGPRKKANLMFLASASLAATPMMAAFIRDADVLAPSGTLLLGASAADADVRTATGLAQNRQVVPRNDPARRVVVTSAKGEEPA